MQNLVMYETEEYTLTLKNSSQNKSLAEGLLDSASFEKYNTFTAGELVVIKNRLLSVCNFPSKIRSKIVRLTVVKGTEHSFEIVNKTDENGNPKIIRVITVSNPEMLGKISQGLAESLQSPQQ